MKIATIKQIGEALGISHQAVSKEFVKKGLLVRNSNGQIDIEDKQNRAFLKSKGANFSIFYPKRKTGTAKPEAKITPKTTEVKVESDNGLQGTTLLQIDVATRVEKLKGIKKDNAIKDLRLEEEKGRLIDKKVVTNIIFDVLGHIARDIQSTPHSIVDEIISIATTQPDAAREKIVNLLRGRQAEAMKKAVKEAEKIARS
jgi:hypothetical protein